MAVPFFWCDFTAQIDGWLELTIVLDFFVQNGFSKSEEETMWICKVKQYASHGGVSEQAPNGRALLAIRGDLLINYLISALFREISTKKQTWPPARSLFFSMEPTPNRTNNLSRKLNKINKTCSRKKTIKTNCRILNWADNLKGDYRIVVVFGFQFSK